MTVRVNRPRGVDCAALWREEASLARRVDREIPAVRAGDAVRAVGAADAARAAAAGATASRMKIIAIPRGSRANRAGSSPFLVNGLTHPARPGRHFGVKESVCRPHSKNGRKK